MTSFSNRGPDGREFMVGSFFDTISNKYCSSLAGLSANDTLPDKSKVFENARVVDVIKENGGVHAILADGTVHAGDVIVGFNGVHSAVRALIWDKAAKQSPGLSETLSLETIVWNLYVCLHVEPT
ncbi:FAD binding domain-containing protein [Colletotrichum plurivorum]|uniref:FAD binding domain-containing protein n=1 Tax=Colletotrichum plurivorum TaxID=2175906 RepID=A0A8H6NF77_9PEZI|nr:FAD binding domain-containing protein [Colletotrichum plurivorum]